MDLSKACARVGFLSLLYQFPNNHSCDAADNALVSIALLTCLNPFADESKSLLQRNPCISCVAPSKLYGCVSLQGFHVCEGPLLRMLNS